MAGIAQPDTSLMSQIISLGTVTGDYIFIDETLPSP